jgi:hypothetical protein
MSTPWRRAVCLHAALNMLAFAAPTDQFWMGQQPDETTAFRLLTDFHLSRITPDRNYLHLVSARMTPVHPASDKKGQLKEAFEKDLELVKRSSTSKEAAPLGQPASAEYRWHVHSPGKDVLYLKPAREIFLPDRNRMFAVYIRGAGHSHHVYALFRGPNRIQQEIFVCSLDYQGWKRFEVVIPPYLQQRNPLRQNRYELYFIGLKIQSHFRDQPGTSVFNLAEMFIMADTSDKRIPGANMPQEF